MLGLLTIIMAEDLAIQCSQISIHRDEDIIVDFGNFVETIDDSKISYCGQTFDT